MDIEQSTLIWLTRIIFAVTIALIGFAVWQFMRRERIVLIPVRKAYRPPVGVDLPEKNISLAVMAKPGRVFDSLQLFKVLHELGFHYSDNQVFEYFVPDSKYIAFSVINARAPYQFDQDPHTMRPTNGIVAIMQLPIADGDNQVAHFHLLLSIVDELCSNLDAELCDTNRNRLKNQKLYDIQKEIEIFEQKYTSTIQHDYQRRDD